MDDLQIIELFFQRDERAIAETQAKYGDLCFHIVYNILNNHEDAEECVNDTYLNVWNTIPPAKPQSLKAFVCKIARNLALTRLKYNNRKKRSPDSLISLSDVEDTLISTSADQHLLDEEAGRVIDKFLREQKSDVRNVFLRRYWFGDSIDDIADRFSFSKSKVKSMLFHTRNKLIKYLHKEDIDL